MTESVPAHNADSVALEKILETQFISRLTTALWLSGCRDFDVLKSDVDNNGHDIVIEAMGVTRHIQLKSMIRGGKKQKVKINLRLAAKPSGCVVWYDYDPETLELIHFRWFGNAPGEGLPDLGQKVGRHTKGNRDGVKASRPNIRQIPKSAFLMVPTIEELTSKLFFGEVAGPRTANA